MTDKVNEAFGGHFIANSWQVFPADIVFRSIQPIRLEAENFGILNIPQALTIDAISEGLGSSSVLTQEGAVNSLAVLDSALSDVNVRRVQVALIESYCEEKR